MSTRLVQVTNVSTSVTKEQLKSLFAHLGRIEDVQLYPESETLTATVASKTGYVRFDRSEFAHAALNLTNTVFLDRPIICSVVKYATSSSALSSKAIAQLCRIPDETVAIKFCPSVNSNVTLIPGGITWPHNIINRVVTIPGVGSNSSTSLIETIDPNLSERSLPPYPPLPGSMDQQKAEEIRRTVYVSNLDPRLKFAHLYELFNQIGEVRYIRLTSISPDDIQLENRGLSTITISDEESINWEAYSIGAYIEFSEQPMVLKALCLNGLKFAERHIKVNHATSAIVIPATNKQQVSVEDLRKDISKLRQSSSSHKDRDRERDRDRDKDRDRDRRDRDRDRDRERDRDRDRDRERDRDRDRDRDRPTKTSKDKESRCDRDRHKRGSKTRETVAVKSSRHDKKRDGSVDEKTSESEEEEHMASSEVNGSGPTSGAESDHSEVAVPSPKKPRRSRSKSKSRSDARKRSKDRSSKERHSSSRKRSSRSREREKRDRDLQREKELRERLKASTHHSSSSSKKSREDESKSGRSERDSSKEHKRSNGSKSDSLHKRERERKRSRSRSGKTKKRSKSKEKSSKDHKKSSRRRSKSKDKTSSRSSHKHSKSSKSDRKESRHEKRDKYESDEVAVGAKTRDYDEEERDNASMDTGDAIVKSPYGPEPVNGQVNNGNDKAQSSSDDSGSSSSDSEVNEPMDTQGNGN